MNIILDDDWPDTIYEMSLGGEVLLVMPDGSKKLVSNGYGESEKQSNPIKLRGVKSAIDLALDNYRDGKIEAGQLAEFALLEMADD